MQNITVEALAPILLSNPKGLLLCRDELAGWFGSFNRYSGKKGAGKAEFFRQWLLIGRREKFDPETMLHRLWLTIGGNDGHAGQYALDIDESRDDDGTRGWEVTIGSAAEAFEESDRQREVAAEAAKEAKRERALERNRQKVRDAFIGGGNLTKTDISMRTGLSGAQSGEAIEYLVRTGELDVTEVTKSNKQKYPAYQRNHPDKK